MFHWSERWQKWKVSKPKTGPGGFVKVWVKIGARTREFGSRPPGLESIRRPCPLGHEPLHFPNPDPADNRLENLRWAPIGASKVGRMMSGSPPPPQFGEAPRTPC